MTGDLSIAHPVVLFDLDGTLTDPYLGITSSIRYAMDKLGQPLGPEVDLAWCIGPPLVEIFQTLLATTDHDRVWAGVLAYRERYGALGLYENRVYDGIPEVLTALVASGRSLRVATSKLETAAQRIIEHFGLARYFTSVDGSQPDASRADKTELIGHVLHSYGLAAEACLMVGDRRHDIIGARANKVTTIGVSWGYGGAVELAAAGADAVVATPAELIRLILTDRRFS